MYKIIVLLFTCIGCAEIHAQQLTGRWYSADSSRVYEIKQVADNELQAVLQSTSRKGEQAGAVVLSKLFWNERKKRYDGIIYAVKDADAPPVPVSITFNKHNSNAITLTLSRMFVMNVHINWLRISS